MVKQQYVWVLKPGKPSVDRKALCKMLGISAGIYTEASADVPAPLQNILKTIGYVVGAIEPKLVKGKYSVISFPVNCGRSKAMLMARMQFGSRLHTHYWIDPVVIPEINELLRCYVDLDES